MNLFNHLPDPKDSDKKHLFEIAAFTLQLAEKARKEGILALDDITDREKLEIAFFYSDITPVKFTPNEHYVFSVLLSLVVDAADADLVHDIARNYVESADAPEKLAIMIGAEGIAGIQEGVNLQVLCAKLASMMGFDFGREFFAEQNKANLEKAKRIAAFRAGNPELRKIEDDDESSYEKQNSLLMRIANGEKIKFEELSLLNIRDLQKVLSTIKGSDLVLALKSTEAEMQARVFSCFTEPYAEIIKNEMDFSGPVKLKDVGKAQALIVENALHLVSQDEIRIHA